MEELKIERALLSKSQNRKGSIMVGQIKGLNFGGAGGVDA